MEKRTKPIIWAALALLLLILGYLVFKNLGPKNGDSPLKPVVNSDGDGKVTVKWDKTKGIDSVAVKWLDVNGRVLGRLVTTENQALIRQTFPNQMVTLVTTPYSGGKEKSESESTLAMFYYSSASAARADSVGTVDIIIQKVSSGTFGGTLEDLCDECPRAYATEEFCDGTWFDIGSPSSDEYYRVTAQGRRADDTPVSVVFILKTTSAGSAQYLAANAAIPCVTLIATNATEISRVTIYDDGVLAFEMHSTENADATPVRGVFLRSLKNVDAFEVEKIWPCPLR